MVMKAYREKLQEQKDNKQACETAVGLSQTLLLADRSNMEHIIEAIRKLQVHSATLAKAA